MLYYLETNSTDPAWNLAFEEYVLTSRTEGDWLLLWQNANTVVIGANQNALEEISPAFVAQHKITVIRRATGGGAVYHDLGNLNYSFITDAGPYETLTMERFARPVCAALQSMGLDAELSGRNDILVNGKKVSGTAQRLCKGRVLHHGTLLFDSDPEMVAGALHADPEKFRSKASKSVRSRIGNIRAMLPEDMDLPAFRARLLETLSGDGLMRCALTEAELAEVQKRAEEKYRAWDWTFGRAPAFDLRAKQRLPGGTLCVELSVANGMIRGARFRGDFMAMTDCAPAAKALEGTPLTREAVEQALAQLDLRPMFGGISAQEIADVMFQ